ncbi:ATP-dependent RNA helicase MRH4 [Paramyrothecium foliicola]|nr:ATP-dependent RNA helicase MRH4 [Paramyrothecium foliicola]
MPPLTFLSACTGCSISSARFRFSQSITSRPLQQCLVQRLSTRRDKARPSRMVLSDKVYRTPARNDRRPRRADVDGPFAGMNRTVANIDPTRKSGGGRPRPGAGGRDSKSPRGDDKRSSPDDRKALKMQRALATVPYGRRTTLKERMSEFDSFDHFDLLPAIKSAITNDVLKGMVDIRPTPVQRLAIPAMLHQKKPEELGLPEAARDKKKSDKEAFLLAAETGSGKTLAYLLPAIDAFKRAEAQDSELQAYTERRTLEIEQQKSLSHKRRAFEEPHPSMGRPKIIVLVPTAELVQQVGRVAKKLSYSAKFKSEMLSSDMKAQQIQRNIFGPKGVDVIISTPHLLASIADSDPNVLSRVTHLIVDEADSLLDRSFGPVTTSIIERAMPSMQQFICCSATIPRKLNNFLATNYPKMVRITTPNLHAIPRRVQLGVMDVSKEPYHNNKDLACADAIYTIGREGSKHEGPVRDEVDVRRIMVFVNERERTEEVAEYLRSKGIDAQALHRDTPEKRHGEVLDMFTSPEPLRIAKPGNPTGRRSLPNVKVLVVTDLASRGIDTLAVRFVILYDVPHTTIDFIHRLGRAGRMGRRGRGVVLVGNDDRKDVVAEVKRSMFMGQALI